MNIPHVEQAKEHAAELANTTTAEIMQRRRAADTLFAEQRAAIEQLQAGLEDGTLLHASDVQQCLCRAVQRAKQAILDNLPAHIRAAAREYTDHQTAGMIEAEVREIVWQALTDASNALSGGVSKPKA